MLVEPNGRVVETLAAYIDLNVVRARLVADPKDYRFCGYGEALAGHERARAGLAAVVSGPALEEADTRRPAWEQVQADYRVTLFGVGSGARPGAGAVSPAELQKVLKAKGRLPRHVVLRCRIRHFTDGAVLGGQTFVAEHLVAYRERTGRRRKSPPKPLPAFTDWGRDLATLRGLRQLGG